MRAASCKQLRFTLMIWFLLNMIDNIKLGLIWGKCIPGVTQGLIANNTASVTYPHVEAITR